MQQVVIAGRYRLLELVGRGGMGRVWRARDEVLDREVALKEIVPPAWLAESERDELRLRTLREARTAARLNHANVVRVYDVVRVEHHPWIIMEYVPSRSLQTVLDTTGPLDPVRAADIGLSLLAALRAAHDAGVLHRDVKPQNVLVAHDGRVMLTDFGLATFDGGDGLTTRPGMVLGSPQFVAPERAAEGVSSVEADLWSLGATLHAAVEGRSPYARSTAMATLAALASSPPDPAPNAGPLRPALEGLLRRDPRRRIRHDETARLLEAVTRPAATVEPPTEQLPVARSGTALVTPPPAWPGARPPAGDSGSGGLSGAAPASPAVPPPVGPLGGPRDMAVHRGAAVVRPGGSDTPLDVIPGPVPASGVARESGHGWTGAPLDTGPPAGGGPSWTAGPLGPPEPPPGARPGRRIGDGAQRWALLAMALLVAVAAGVGTALAVTRDIDDDRPAGAGGSSAPQEHPEPPPGGEPGRRGEDGYRPPPPFPCLRPDPVGEPIARGSATADDGFRPPAGWTWHAGTGYRIAVPVGWLLSRNGTVVCLRDPTSRRTVSVEPVTSDAADPLARLRAEERRELDRGTLPSYDKVRLAADGRGAVWECRWVAPFGERQHALRMLPGGDLGGWTIGFSTSDADWEAARPELAVFRESFRSGASARITPT
ncbi:serine/threonine-protein kinase [Micromonospora siamensis]|uniref:non-specific serine/threonine protein kinase n=1 Tax=Micromonospora siamensis TaxID=299152 RepID=A0A1C5J9P3_9ACTN|nr:serine/threonine-protein kinase [Micromonospora siamensis]SCG67268.1 Serine/threonine protein kinase [Micromonospora siamensis]